MKKIVAILAVVAITFASCKKEEGATPSLKAEKTVMGGEKRDMSGWD
ncbi:hypothetical protein [Arcticibacter sp.]|jgi:hypothetical protein